MDIMNASKNNVLKTVGKNTFRFIRETAGIDFEKPVIIRAGYGPFTLRKICDILPDFDCNYTVTIIVDTDYRGWYIVKMAKNGRDFVTELNPKTYFHDYHTIPSTFYRKSDFETARKSDRAFYVIAQLAAYSLPLKTRENYTYGRRAIKDNSRYIIENKSYAVTATGNIRYLCRLSLIEEGGTGKKFDWNVYENVPHAFQQKFDLSELFDKSGYYVFNRRAELKRKAAAIRAERAKNEYLSADTSALVPNLKTAAHGLNEMLSEKAAAASNYDALDNLWELVSKVKRIYRGIEFFENKQTEKRFSSLKQAQEEFEKIMKDIEEVKAS